MIIVLRRAKYLVGVAVDRFAVTAYNEPGREPVMSTTMLPS